MTAQPVPSDQAGKQHWAGVLRSPGLVGLNLAARVIYTLLWEWVGFGEGSLSVTVAGIADALKLRERHVRDCLHRLAVRGTVDVVDWFRDGTVNLYVYSPESCGGPRVRKRDPHGELFDKNPTPTPGPSKASRTVPIDATQRELADLARRKKRQLQAEQKPHEVGVVDVLPEALRNILFQLTDATDPAEQKRRLVARIKQVVRDGDMNDSLPGRAVDLVIAGKARWGDVQRILDGIAAVREAKAAGRGDGFKTSPGAYFVKCVRKLSGWNDQERR